MQFSKFYITVLHSFTNTPINSTGSNCMSDQIAQLERNISQAKELADLGTSLERLRNNRDFKKLIMDHYLEKEAVRLVHLKADASMQTPQHQQSITAQIDAIGIFTNYLNTVLAMATRAKVDIADSEETLAELRAEALTDE